MIHSTAIIHPRAIIGSNVSIGPYTTIGDKVVIKDDVEIASHVTIEGSCEIGSGTRIFPFASIGLAPQDLKYKGEDTKLIIGSNNTIREFTTLNRGTARGGGVTSIGDNNLFMTQTHVAHDSKIGSHNVFANAASLAGHVTIEDHVILGAFCGVHQFCRVGRYAIIGGLTKLVKDGLPYSKTDGIPAKCYGANTLGLRRHGFTNESIRSIGKAFHILLTSKLNTTQAIERMKSELGDIDEIRYMIRFIETSERAVTK